MGLHTLGAMLRSDTEEELQMTFSLLMIRDGCGWDSGRDVKNTHHMLRALSVQRYKHTGKARAVFQERKDHICLPLSVSR